MAGNEWINGYLEAILDAGAKRKEQNQSHLSASVKFKIMAMELQSYGAGSDNKEKEAAYSPAKYFVEEVVSRFDDSDLHKTWVKVVATRNSQERNNRLENLCWRIWHLARKKKQIESDSTRRLLQRKVEQEQGSKEAAEDLSELSEGEKDVKADNGSNNNNSHVAVYSRINANCNSDTRVIVSDEEDGEGQKEEEHLYVVLISLHGLIRGDNMELGRDSDTGGQVKYVVELARALAATKGVYRVDLLTRQVSSPDVHWTYGEPVEMLSSPPDDDDDDAASSSCGAYIIRLPCGPRDQYIPKESLWPHIPEFVDRALAHITNVAKSLGEQFSSNPSNPVTPVWPYAIHGHYADAAEVAAHLASILSVPMVMTGHSLGRNKLEQLLKQGRLTKDDINSTYRIMRRIEGEETGIDVAEMVVTSTKQEIEEQWGLYDGFDLMLERKLRVRKKRGVSCLGRHMPRMVVIPPGMDFSYVNTQDLEKDGDLQMLINSNSSQNKRDLPPIWSEVMRFFTNPHKPMILALSRPDPKKNVMTLLKAYGESPHLQELANLTLILGNRDDIEEMAGSSATVLTNVLKLIDKYDLYGKVAYPKHHKQSDVPQIYRLAAKTKGVFINPALVEPFGLTLIEAAAYGLPVVATKNGGPVDILKALNNGLLVDPHDQVAISEALLRLLADKSLWLECRRSGLRHIHRFSWPHHCHLFLAHLSSLLLRSSAPSLSLSAPRVPQSEPLSESLRDLSLHFSTDSPDALVTESSIDLNRLRRMESSSTLSFSHGHRQSIFVITIDCYSDEGAIEIPRLKEIIDKVTSLDRSNGRIGYVLSTGSTILETLEAIKSCNIDPTRFDALICSSGAEMCYPWRDTSADMDYGSHLGFRWPGEHVRETIRKVAKLDGADGDLVFDEIASSAYCFAYVVKAENNVRKVDGIKQRLRMRGFRCNVVYTHACRRLNIIPLFASRSHALRYLSIQWGIDLSKVVLFTGEKGDTDCEKLLPGLHKTVILRGFVDIGSEKLLREEDSYKLEDVFSTEAPNIITLDKDCSTSDMTSAI